MAAGIPLKTGGWNTAENWKDENGAAGVPSAGDTVIFNQYAEHVVVNDEDFALFNSMARVNLTSFAWVLHYGQEIILDVTQDVKIHPAIYGQGRLIIRGSNHVELMSEDWDAAVTKPYEFYDQYALNAGGIKVEGGTLTLVQSATHPCFYQPIEIAEGATVELSTNANTCIVALYGKGTVVQRGTKARELQIYYNGATIDDAKELPFPGASMPPVFEGKISGNLTVNVQGSQAFTGVENDFTGGIKTVKNANTESSGWMWFKRLGMTGQPSSTGAGTGSSGRIYLFHGGSIGYIGDGTAETSDHVIQFDMQKSGTRLYPSYFDAGTNGNLTLTGIINTDAWGDSWNMRSFVLTGSNAAPCTIAGPYCPRIAAQSGVEGKEHAYDLYTRKEGPGTWAFKYHSSTSFRGVFDIREGVLAFDSIAQAGEKCALGYADNLTCEYEGKYDAAYDSIYAYRLGKSSAEKADAVFEFNGATSCASTNRPMLLTGDGHIRANGTSGAALIFADVRSESGMKTLTLDGDSTSTNTLSEVDEGTGTLSLVKDGAGAWNLDGNQNISGNLDVREGTLRLCGRDPYRYFKVTVWDSVAESPYGSPYGGYMAQVGLYSATGKRLNDGLKFTLPAGANWSSSYTFSQKDTDDLAPGYLTFAPGTCYLYQNYNLNNLIDGTSSLVQFSQVLKNASVAMVMRLEDDTDEVAYFDFAQSAENYQSAGWQTPSAFKLEGSIDGTSWKELLQKTDLPFRGRKWYYSESNLAINAGDRTMGNGEGVALDHRAADETTRTFLDDLQWVSVAPGAELIGTGRFDLPTISKLRIDGTTGCGKISGLEFASQVTVDVTGNLRADETVTLPVDFSEVENFNDVSWSFLNDGVARKLYSFTLTRTTLTIRQPGTVIIIR